MFQPIKFLWNEHDHHRLAGIWNGNADRPWSVFVKAVQEVVRDRKGGRFLYITVHLTNIYWTLISSLFVFSVSVVNVFHLALIRIQLQSLIFQWSKTLLWVLDFWVLVTRKLLIKQPCLRGGSSDVSDVTHGSLTWIPGIPGFPRLRGANPWGRIPIVWHNFLSKTAWKWEKIYWGARLAPSSPSPRSANGWCDYRSRL